MRTVFFGTPDFAVPSLRALLGEGFDVAAVVTQPDKPHGRSRSSVVAPPVKEVATEEDLLVLQPERPVGADFYQSVRDLEPDLGVVVAYGHILKPELLTIPRYGMINVHASLLPKLRGAAPVQHAIIQGLAETGVSIMQMDQGMDTGAVRLSVATPILSDETGGELTSRLSELGALALVEALELLSTDALQSEPQDHAAATFAPKITREVSRIRWDQSAEQVARLARALDPRPGAWTTLEDREVKLFGARVREGAGDAAPGTVLEADSALVVMTADRAVEFIDVQSSGAARMTAGSWTRGRGASSGQRFV
jgi:methionyl-tRNA formyltransferase